MNDDILDGINVDKHSIKHAMEDAGMVIHGHEASDDTTQELLDEVQNCTELLIASSKLARNEVINLINSIVDCEVELEGRSNT